MHNAFLTLLAHRELHYPVVQITAEWQECSTHANTIPRADMGSWSWQSFWLSLRIHPLSLQCIIFMSGILEIDMSYSCCCQWHLCCGCHCMHISLHNRSQKFGRKVQSTRRNIASPTLSIGIGNRRALCEEHTHWPQWVKDTPQRSSTLNVEKLRKTKVNFFLSYVLFYEGTRVNKC